MTGCSANYLPISGKLDIKKRPPVWLTFGGPIQESFKKWLAGELKSEFKNKDRLCVIELFTALALRESAADSRDSGGKYYVWQVDRFDTRKDAFFSQTGRNMQRELIRTVIEIAKKSGVNYKISFMWEAQVLSGDRRFLPWLREMVTFCETFDVKSGVHSHVVSHRKVAYFVVFEGNSARDLHLLNLDRPVYCLRRNPSPFKSGKIADNVKAPQGEILEKLQLQMLHDLVHVGCTGMPFPMWINQKSMDSRAPGSDFDCKRFNKKMKAFILNISRGLRKYKDKELPRDFGQQFVNRAHPQLAPPPKEEKPVEVPEEDKPTDPLPEQPVVKEKEMSNTEYWRHLARTWPRRWWHKLTPLPVGLLLAILIQVRVAPWWWMPIATVALFFIDGIVERRKRKEDSIKYRFLSADGSDSETLAPFAKTPKCPDE